MIYAIEKGKILKLLKAQLENSFLLTVEEYLELEASFDKAMDACEDNFLSNNLKYFTREVDGKCEAYFNPYHSVEYMIFLYYLAHIIFLQGSKTLVCDKLYYLNKMLNGVDLFYPIDLPKHFGAEHPLGSVMGRAKYGEYFYFYQNCTVGGVIKEGREIYPVIGNNVELCSNSSVLGDCHIGNNVTIGAGALVKNQNVPDNSLVFGESPNIIIKEKKNNFTNFKN